MRREGKVRVWRSMWDKEEKGEDGRKREGGDDREES